MDNKTQIAITGGTGFIGGRLAERLVLEHDMRPRCLVRDYSHCASLSRLNVDLVQVDLTDADKVRAAIQDCQYVIHCAYSWDESVHTARQANICGAVNLYRAAAATSCCRFVHVSTDAVHGFDKPAEIDESFPLSKDPHPYIMTKVELERRLTCLSRGHRHAPLTIIRPAVVFGPGMNTWTTTIVSDILKGLQFLVDDGRGICNTLYVDNLVDALLLACEKEEAVGQCFLITDGEILTWWQYVAAFADLCNVDMSTMLKINSADVRRLRQEAHLPRPSLLSVLSSAPVRAQLLSVPWISDLWQFCKSRQCFCTERVAQKGSVLAKVDPFRAAVYDNKTVYCIEKARTLLGYSPNVPFAEAMQRTAEWLRFAHKLSY